MIQDQINQVTAGLLILSLATVLAMAMISLLFIRHYIRGRRLKNNPSPTENWDSSYRTTKYRPTIFEKPCRWLVVKSTNVAAVQNALGLHNATPCSWGEGLSKLAQRKLFVSPPVQGWILVIGQALPEPSEDVDECYRFIMRLTRELGHVQYYSSNRAVNHHAWVRAENGQIRRAYAWAGETLWNQGEISATELSLGLKCYGYGDPPEQFQASESDSHAGNSEKVVFLAARWSFDPTAIDESVVAGGHGIYGDLTHSPLR
jgi:hypothetical protein